VRDPRYLENPHSIRIFWRGAGAFQTDVVPFHGFNRQMLVTDRYR